MILAHTKETRLDWFRMYFPKLCARQPALTKNYAPTFSMTWIPRSATCWIAMRKTAKLLLVQVTFYFSTPTMSTSNDIIAGNGRILTKCMLTDAGSRYDLNQ